MLWRPASVTRWVIFRDRGAGLAGRQVQVQMWSSRWRAFRSRISRASAPQAISRTVRLSAGRGSPVFGQVRSVICVMFCSIEEGPLRVPETGP